MAIDRVLRALAEENPEAMRLADAICWLIVKGAELGELDVYSVPDRAALAAGVKDPPTIPRKRGLRPEWLARLARAVEVGACSRLSGEEIADRILQVPAA